jgi:hypothetical protein
MSGLTKKIRIKSLILREKGKIIQLNNDMMKRLVPVRFKREERQATKIKSEQIARELDTNIVEMNITEDYYEYLIYIFKLYGIPFKPIKNGVEIDIREKEPYEPEYE